MVGIRLAQVEVKWSSQVMDHDGALGGWPRYGTDVVGMVWFHSSMVYLRSRAGQAVPGSCQETSGQG